MTINEQQHLLHCDACVMILGLCTVSSNQMEFEHRMRDMGYAIHGQKQN